MVARCVVVPVDPMRIFPLKRESPLKNDVEEAFNIPRMFTLPDESIAKIGFVAALDVAIMNNGAVCPAVP